MGRTAFTPTELAAIKSLLREIRAAERSRQKSLRARLRREFGFYISDFASDQQGFVASDVDALVRRGVITVVVQPGDAQRSVGVSKQPARARSASAAPRSRQAAAPASFFREDLKEAGFVGWRTWKDLHASRFADIPGGPGVYVVYRPSSAPPVFLDVNPGGHFKGRDPTVNVERLAAAWVQDAHVIYIGKAEGLRVRLRQYARFGAGEPVGHWGGRYVWQVSDSDETLVAWHAITWQERARDYERRLMQQFADVHAARRPFANLVG